MSRPDSIVDLRSDTVTRPSPAMRRAMAEAEVGDDVLEEDSTVLRLQAVAAELLGHEAALFMPSGTMGNQVALHLLSRPGEEVICEAGSHIVQFEMGAMAALSGLLPRTVDGVNGRMTPEQVEREIAAACGLQNPTALLELENSSNLGGGTVYTLPELESLLDVARAHGLPVHLDGARLFNAAEVIGVPVAALAGGFDTVMVSLSKGLGAPVGSLLFGRTELMERARRVRKMFGGGMRQVGVLAAAGLVGLEEGPQQIPHDHAHARRLAQGIEELPGLTVDLASVQTNIVLARPNAPAGSAVRAVVQSILDGLRARGVLASSLDGESIRFVTHRDVDAEGIDRALRALHEVV